MNRISFVILAAGKSRRMKSTKSKVLHNINERPIINYVNDIADKSGHVNVLDVLLEANVSNAYLDMGTEILNGTKSPQEAMDFIRKVALEAKAAM